MRNRLTDAENKLAAAAAEGGTRMGQIGEGIERDKFPVIKSVMGMKYTA